MRRGGMAVILAAVLLVAVTQPALAVGELGSIRVTAEPGMAGSTLMLSYVGILWAEGLQLMPEFGGGYVTREDMHSGELAQWLQEQAWEGLERTVDEEGVAMFTGLPEGVYLLYQRTGSMDPVLLRLPEEDGSWMAQIRVTLDPQYEVPATGQPVTPVLAAMGMVLSAFGIGIWYESWHKRRKK